MGICNFDSKNHKNNFVLRGIIEPVEIKRPEEKIDYLEDKRNESKGNIESVQYNDLDKSFGISTKILDDMYGNNKNVDKQKKVKDEQNINNENNIMNDNQERNNSSFDKNSEDKINTSKKEPSINTPEENLNLPNTSLNDIGNDNPKNNTNNDDDNNISNDNKGKIIDNVSYNTPFELPKRVESKNDCNSKMDHQSSLYTNNKQNTKYLKNSQKENNNSDDGKKIYINSKETPEYQIQNNANNNEPNKIEDDQNYNLFSNNENQLTNRQENNNSNDINALGQNKEIINSKNGLDNSQINNINQQNIENNNYAKNNYDNLDISKTYYLSCPYCKKYQPYIESIEYDTNENDFLITYICPCNSSDDSKKKVYFSSFFVGARK